MSNGEYTMDNPYDFFDKIYCLNLNESKDRWATVSKEFETIGIDNRVIRLSAPKADDNIFTANTNKAGQYGCTMSHLKILGNALADANGHIVIFEDDIHFPDYSAAHLQDIIDNLPNDWDILYLGGRPVEPVTNVYNNKLYKASCMFGSYGYAVNHKFIKTIFNGIFESLMKSGNKNGIYDVLLGRITKANNGYAVYPLVVKEQSSFSIIENRATTNYDQLMENSWARMKQK